MSINSQRRLDLCFTGRGVTFPTVKDFLTVQIFALQRIYPTPAGEGLTPRQFKGAHEPRTTQTDEEQARIQRDEDGGYHVPGKEKLQEEIQARCDPARG